MKKDILYSNYAKDLTNEYKEAYEQIEIYIEAASHAGDDLSLVMNEIVDLLLSAQHDKRTLESIIGNDIKYFCDQMIESHTYSIKDRLFNFLNFYRILSLIAFGIESISLFIDYQDGIKNPLIKSVGMGGFVFAILISFSIFGIFKIITKRIVFKYKWYTKKLDTVISSILLIILFIGIIFLPEEVNHFVPLPRWLFLPSMIIVFIICTIHKRKEKQKDIEEGNYYSFNEIAYNSNIEVLREKYNKYLKKCQKNKIQPKDVNKWYEERYIKDMRGEKYGKIGFVLIILIAIVGTMMTSEFIDGIIFAIILICFEIPIYHFLDKGRLARIKIHNDINERQTDIFDESLLIKDIGI